LGLETGQLPALAKQGYSDIRSLKTRRVYMLAVNHRQPSLADLNLRRALAHGLRREQILDDAFRGTVKDAPDRKFHGPANGPFPRHHGPVVPPRAFPKTFITGVGQVACQESRR